MAISLNIKRLRYKELSILEKPYQVASAVVRTKMCPTDIRLVVIRSRPKRSKPYRYFCVFTTDMTLEIPKIVVGIHWYHPRHLTQGLRVAYLQSQFKALEYSASGPRKDELAEYSSRI